jgi:hypothetical protein
MLSVWLITERCANVAKGPDGGPKDSISPVLLYIYPEYLAVNQTPKKIRWTFNEYVQVKEASKNVIVSPPSLRKPQVRTRGKGVEVVFEDSLQANTTYVVDFGGAVVDLNESNPFDAFRYVFSTGSEIDSMMLTGKVLDAFTKEPVAKMTVCLYENRTDTTIYKTMPHIVTRTDNWGYFTLQNIKHRPYHMVAFEDKNNNFRYDAGAETLAFADSLITPDSLVNYTVLLDVIDAKDTARLLTRRYEKDLLAFKETAGKQFLKEQILESPRKIILVFSQPQAQILQFCVNNSDSLMVTEHSQFNDTLIYWLTAPVLPDTTQAEITYMRTDSLGGLSPSYTKLKLQIPKIIEEKKKDDKKKDDEKEKKEVLLPTINYTAENVTESGVTISFKTLPVKIDTALVQLWRIDDADKNKKRIPESFTWIPDSVRLRQFRVHTKWRESSEYELLVLSGAFTDIFGLSNDSIVKKITIDNPEKYSSIVVNLSGIDSAQQVIVQLLDEKKTKVQRSYIVTENKKLPLTYLRPGKYTLRFIADANKNGIWDVGNYLEKRQAEAVEFYLLPEGGELITLLENTEINQDIDLKQIFARDRRKEVPKLILEEETEDSDSITK